MGENLSSEATTSGTVGAALEGASQSVPSIAVSVHTGKEFRLDDANNTIDFSLSKIITNKLAKFILKEGMPKGTDLFNVNVPASSSKHRIRLTRLARRMYTTKVKKRLDPRGRSYFWIDGDPIYQANEGTDVHAVRIENSISITPMQLDLTREKSMKNLMNLERLLD
jgi:5'-nucleotidase|tara:strand:+ start:8247 stop:8747 length:501 start_codon:yes stop_codon:yes gene_type:complete